MPRQLRLTRTTIGPGVPRRRRDNDPEQYGREYFRALIEDHLQATTGWQGAPVQLASATLS